MISPCAKVLDDFIHQPNINHARNLSRNLQQPQVMRVMKVYFSHGKESGPHGSKIKALAGIAVEAGLTTESIDYTAKADPDSRVELLLESINRDEEYILVGSSMGAYVSLPASESCSPEGLFLLAPALYLPGYNKQVFQPKISDIEIVHGWNDDVVPVQNSIEFASKHKLSLHILHSDHRLNSALPEICELFRRFLQNLRPED